MRFDNGAFSEERFVSGHRFSDAARAENADGFSRWSSPLYGRTG